jgi:hypothetical protein
MLTSSDFAIQTGAVTQPLANRRPATSFVWRVEPFLGVQRSKPWLPCHQLSRNMLDLVWLRKKRIGCDDWLVELEYRKYTMVNPLLFWPTTKEASNWRRTIRPARGRNILIFVTILQRTPFWKGKLRSSTAALRKWLQT